MRAGSPSINLMQLSASCSSAWRERSWIWHPLPAVCHLLLTCFSKYHVLLVSRTGLSLLWVPLAVFKVLRAKPVADRRGFPNLEKFLGLTYLSPFAIHVVAINPSWHSSIYLNPGTTSDKLNFPILFSQNFLVFTTTCYGSLYYTLIALLCSCLRKLYWASP